jgi:hypothetical protein
MWPQLPLTDWADTQTTLHRWLQIAGKTRLALAPMQNHWWQCALYVTARGLGTSPMPYAKGSVELEFDFLEHRLVARTSDGATKSIPLSARSVADFYHDYLGLLAGLGVTAKIWPVPQEMADTVRFDTDREHASYDADAAQRCWRILAHTDRVLQRFRGSFLGKSSPSHFWWGSFDLACTRFSGRPAPRHPGGIPNLSDFVTREAYSHECISAGWWPGSVGGPVAEPAFYAYAYPEPAGCSDAAVRPAATRYLAAMREWILPYEAVRMARDPEGALLDFLRSTYEAAADRGGWDRARLERA